jgi:hypothetical protein
MSHKMNLATKRAWGEKRREVLLRVNLPGVPVPLQPVPAHGPIAPRTLPTAASC